MKTCWVPRYFLPVWKDSIIYFSSVSTSDENLRFTAFLLLNFRGVSGVFRECPLTSFPHLSSLIGSIYTFAPKFSSQPKCLAHPAMLPRPPTTVISLQINSLSSTFSRECSPSNPCLPVGHHMAFTLMFQLWTLLSHETGEAFRPNKCATSRH